MILHTNLVEKWDVFDHNPLNLLELIISEVTLRSDSFEYEELVLFLLVFYQIFATNYRKVIFTL